MNCLRVSTSLCRRNKSAEVNFLLPIQREYRRFHAATLKLHSGACCMRSHITSSQHQQREHAVTSSQGARCRHGVIPLMPYGYSYRTL